MGFRLPLRTARLVFEGDFAGAEVRIRLDQPLGALLQAQRLQSAQDIEGLCEFLAGLVLEWNLEDDAGPLPATAAGLLRCTTVFVNLLIDEWLKAQTGVPAPLGGNSLNGARSVEPLPPTGLGLESLTN